MSYLEDTIDWQAVQSIDEWLDRDVSRLYRDEPLAQDWARIGKVIEELGEAIAALVGNTGQNPRKGVTHSQQDVLEELGDTAITAILAIQHFTKSTGRTRAVIRAKIASIEKRVPRQQAGEGITGLHRDNLGSGGTS